MADEKKPKKKVVRKVTGTATEEAFQKGRRSGQASAAAKARAKPRKKGPKQYRMKKIVPHIKNSYGKFQSKHPYVSTAAEVGTVGALAVGGAVAVARSLNVSTHRFSERIDRIPVARGFYRAGISAMQAVMRWFR